MQLRGFIVDTRQCRATVLAAAMEQPEPEPPCGKCDNCLWRERLRRGGLPESVKGARLTLGSSALCRRGGGGAGSTGDRGGGGGGSSFGGGGWSGGGSSVGGDGCGMPRAHAGDNLAPVVTVDLSKAGGMLLSLLQPLQAFSSWTSLHKLLQEHTGLMSCGPARTELQSAAGGGWTVNHLRLLLDAMAEEADATGSGPPQLAAGFSHPPPPLVLMKMSAPQPQRTPHMLYRLNMNISPDERKRRLASFPLPRFLREELLQVEGEAEAKRARAEAKAAAAAEAKAEVAAAAAAAKAAAAAAAVVGLSWLGPAESAEEACAALAPGKRVAVLYEEDGGGEKWYTGPVVSLGPRAGDNKDVRFYMRCDGYNFDSGVQMRLSLQSSYGRHSGWIMIPKGVEAPVWREKGHEFLGLTGCFRDDKTGAVCKGVVRLWRPGAPGQPAVEGGAGAAAGGEAAGAAADEPSFSVALSLRSESKNLSELVVSLLQAQAAISAHRRGMSAGNAPAAEPPSVSMPAAPTGRVSKRARSPSPGTLSALEQKRLDNIRQNNAELERMGLLGPGAAGSSSRARVGQSVRHNAGGEGGGAEDDSLASRPVSELAIPAAASEDEDDAMAISEGEDAVSPADRTISGIPAAGISKDGELEALISAAEVPGGVDAEAPIEAPAEPMEVEVPQGAPMLGGGAASPMPGGAPLPMPGRASLPVPVGAPFSGPVRCVEEEDETAYDMTDEMLEAYLETEAQLLRAEEEAQVAEASVEVGRSSALPYALAFYLEHMDVLAQMDPAIEQILAAACGPAQWQKLLAGHFSTGRLVRVPTPPPGGTLAYCANLDTDGHLKLLPPERRGRSLSAAAFGSEQLLLVSFLDLPRDDAAGAGRARAAAEQAQRRALTRGIRVCGREFVFFCAKEDHSAKDTKAVFIARRHEGGGAAGGGGGSRTDTGGQGSLFGWSSPAEARRMLADFASLPPAKLTKRLALAFSQTTRCLSGCVRQVDLVDLRHPPPGQAAAAAARSFLSAARPPAAPALLSLLGLEGAQALAATGAPPEGTVRILIVDDICHGGSHIMTDGAGLVSMDLMQRVAAEAVAHASARAGVVDGAADASAAGAALGAQVRLWFHGSVAKGMLLVASPLPARTIVLTNSMVKVQPAGAAQWPNFYFEVVRLTESRGREPRAGSLLIPILQHGCGLQPAVRYLKGLVAAGVEAMPPAARGMAHDAPARGAKMADMIMRAGSRTAAAGGGGGCRFGRGGGFGGGGLGNGDGGGYGSASAADLVEAGFNPLREPWLMRKANDLVVSEFKRLREGKLPLGNQAHYVIGFPDFSGSLPEGASFLVVNGLAAYPSCAAAGAEAGAGWAGAGDGSGGGASLCVFGGQALVYRAPGCLAGDARRVAIARTCPGLEGMLFGSGPAGGTGKGGYISPDLAFAVFFSTRGERPLADYLAGGDYDGDDFLVCLDRELVSLFNHLPPGEGPGASSPPPAAPAVRNLPPANPPASLSPPALETALADEFFRRRHTGAFDVGRAATAFKAMCDRYGMGDSRAIRLGVLYQQALDEALTPAESKELKDLAVMAAQVRPAWMDEEEDARGIGQGAGGGGGAPTSASGQGSAMVQIHSHVHEEMRRRQDLTVGGGGVGGMDRHIAALVREWAVGDGEVDGVSDAAEAKRRRLVWKRAENFAKDCRKTYLDEYFALDRELKALEKAGMPVSVEMRRSR